MMVPGCYYEITCLDPKNPGYYARVLCVSVTAGHATVQWKNSDGGVKKESVNLSQSTYSLLEK